MYTCICYLPHSCIHTLCQLSSTASAMHQSLHMLVLYIFTCWMLQDLCTHLSAFPRWRLLLLNVSLFHHDWSYVDLVYLLNFSTWFEMSSNRPLTKSLLGLTALLSSACWEVIHDGSKLMWPTVYPKLLRFYHQIAGAMYTAHKTGGLCIHRFVPIWTPLSYSMVGRTWLAGVRWISVVLPATCSCSSCATRGEHCVSTHLNRK